MGKNFQIRSGAILDWHCPPNGNKRSSMTCPRLRVSAVNRSSQPAVIRPDRGSLGLTDSGDLLAIRLQQLLGVLPRCLRKLLTA
jgi:hypothetical protein